MSTKKDVTAIQIRFKVKQISIKLRCSLCMKDQLQAKKSLRKFAIKNSNFKQIRFKMSLSLRWDHLYEVIRHT